MRLTRRAALGGGLIAAAWRIAPARADAPAPAPDGALVLEAAPSRLALAPPPAEPAATYAYAGAIPGPLLRLKKGEALKLRLVNRLAEPTSFKLFRAEDRQFRRRLRRPDRAAARARRRAPTSALSRPIPASTSICRTPARPTPASRAAGCSGRSSSRRRSSPTSISTSRSCCRTGASTRAVEIKDDFADPALARGAGRKGALVLANNVGAPLKLTARPGARVRLRLGNAATARIATIAVEGAKSLIVAVDGQPSAPFEPLRGQFPIGPGARFELMFDMPREPAAKAGLTLKGEAGEADRPFVAIAAEGEPVAAANPISPASSPIRCCRRKSALRSPSASIAPSPAAARRRSRSMASLSSTGRRSPPSPFRAARRPCSRSPTRRRSCRRCGSAAMSRGFCMRWTTAGSPTGATPS